MIRKALAVLWAVCLVSGGVGMQVVRADVVVDVPFYDSGYFGADGRNSKEDGEAMGAPTTVPTFANYHVGLSDGYSDPPYPDTEMRNFFVFDWGAVLVPFGGAIPGPILSATLKLYNPGTGPDGADGYDSSDASETYYVSDIGTKTPAEVMGHYDHPYYGGPDESAAAIAVYTELAAGSEFASVSVSSADNGTDVDIPLLPIGVDYLNTLLGDYDMSGGVLDKFAFGGKVTTIDGVMGDATDDPYEEIFGYTHPNGEVSPDTSGTPPMIEIVFAPEPATLALLAGIGGYGVVRRRIRGC